MAGLLLMSNQGVMMTTSTHRRWRLTVAALLLISTLSACAHSPFLSGPSSIYKQVDNIEHQLQIESLGQTIWTSRFGTGKFSNPPTLELEIVGRSVSTTIAGRLRSAGFFPKVRGTGQTEWIRPSKYGDQNVYVDDFGPGQKVFRHQNGSGSTESSTPTARGSLISIVSFHDRAKSKS